MTKHFLGIILLAVAVLLVFALVLPAYDQFKQVRIVRDDRESLLQKSKTARDNITVLNRDYMDHEDLTKRLLVALPVSREVDYLTSSIQTAAATSGAQLLALAVSDPIKQEGYQSIPAKIDLACKYPDCLRFMQSLETSLRLYDLKKISIAESSGGSTSGFLNLNISLTTYSLK